MNKKGLASIIINLLILLLVFTSTVVLWINVKNVLTEGAEEISVGRFTIDLEMQSVKIGNNSIEVNVKRNAGKGELSEIKFVISDGENSEIIEIKTSIAELESKTFLIMAKNLEKINLANIDSVSIAPVLSSGTGEVEDTHLIQENDYTGEMITMDDLGKENETFMENETVEDGGNGSVIGDAQCSDTISNFGVYEKKNCTLGDGTVLPSYCNGDTLVYYWCCDAGCSLPEKGCYVKEYDCEEGCGDGACISPVQNPGCFDSDGGEEYYIKGTLDYVSLSPESPDYIGLEDSCGSNNITVYEKICFWKNDDPTTNVAVGFGTRLMDCPNGCLDGACVP